MSSPITQSCDCPWSTACGHKRTSCAASADRGAQVELLVAGHTLLVARGDAAVLLQPADGPFHDVAIPIPLPAVGDRHPESRGGNAGCWPYGAARAQDEQLGRTLGNAEFRGCLARNGRASGALMVGRRLGGRSGKAAVGEPPLAPAHAVVKSPALPTRVRARRRGIATLGSLSLLPVQSGPSPF